MATTELSLQATDQLVRRTRTGDDAAFAQLVEAHQAAVFGTALRIVRDRETAADVASRAFYKAYQHLDSFDASRPLRAWLVRIAANEALNELRGGQQDRARTISGAAADIELERVAGGADPAEIVPSAERSATLRAAVERLPEAQRVVVTLRYFTELSYADIAELTQQSVNNVGVTLLRARERLRRDLEERGVTPDGLS